MAEIAKSGRPSLSTLEPGYEHQLNGVVAGEAIATGDLVYIRASDGRAMRATGAAAGVAAVARGIVFQAAVAGDGVSIHSGLQAHYGAGLTPGASLYLSGTVAGGLADAPSTGGTTEIAYAVDATRIRVKSL